MNEKEKFILLYLDDYVKMAYRRLRNIVDEEAESRLINNLYMLLDEYSDGELSKYINNKSIK